MTEWTKKTELLNGGLKRRRSARQQQSGRRALKRKKNAETEPLTNTKNSCYIDATLVSLFTHPCFDINTLLQDDAVGFDVCGAAEDDIVAARSSFIQAAAALQQWQTKNSDYERNVIRKTATRCPDLNDGFEKSSQNDPSIFLEYFLKIFPRFDMDMMIKGMPSCESSMPLIRLAFDFLAKKKLIGNRKCESNKSYHSPTNLKRCKLKKKSKTTLQKVVDEQIRANQIIKIDTEFIVFDITRLDKGSYIDNIVVEPDKHIKLPQKQKLSLSAVIVWHDHHYTAYAFTKEGWCYFDDEQQEYQIVGRSYDDLLKHRDGSVATNGKLFFYDLCGDGARPRPLRGGGRSKRCNATTAKGSMCKNSGGHNGYCHLHK